MGKMDATFTILKGYLPKQLVPVSGDEPIHTIGEWLDQWELEQYRQHPSPLQSRQQGKKRIESTGYSTIREQQQGDIRSARAMADA